MKHLLIADLEANFYRDRLQEPRGFVNEICEIGCYLYDTTRPINLVTDKNWSTFVGCKWPITKDTTDLTTITAEDVRKAPTLRGALDLLNAAFSLDQVVFASWGDYDRKMLTQGCDRITKEDGRPLRYPFSPAHINLKVEFAALYNRTLKPVHPLPERGIGMERALQLTRMPLVGTHHRGVDDVKNIARIAAWMIGHGWSHPDLLAE